MTNVKARQKICSQGIGNKLSEQFAGVLVESVHEDRWPLYRNPIVPRPMEESDGAVDDHIVGVA
jgi:hypothetical protein